MRNDTESYYREDPNWTLPVRCYVKYASGVGK